MTYLTMRRLVTRVAGIGLLGLAPVLPLGGCSDGDTSDDAAPFCPAVATTDFASLMFSTPLSAAGEYALEIETSELSCTVRLTLDPALTGGGGASAAPSPPPSEGDDCPLGRAGDGPGIFVEVNYRDGALAGITLSQVSGSGFAATVPSLRYWAFRDAELVTEGEVDFDYEASELHGPGCGFSYAATATVSEK